MKSHPKLFLFALLTFAAACFPIAVFGRANADQSQDPAVEAQEEGPEYEEQYNAWESASKEPDLLKRGSMLMQFLEKYPKSKLIAYIDSSYKNLLFECSNGKKYQELETLAEQWLKYHPDDLQTIAYIADAAQKLGHNEKYVQNLLKIYQIQPTANMANAIAQTYKKLNNMPEYLEWAQTVFKYPEYESDFMLRYELVQYYTREKDFAKAAEYARVTLKAAGLVKDPSAETKEQLRAIRHACYHLIGVNQFEKDKFAEAIEAFQQALKAEKYGEGYYYIGLCLRNQDKIDDAMISLAKAELQGGEAAPKAKDYLEKLYKSLHNNTLIGIDKIYRKAKEQPESAENLK